MHIKAVVKKNTYIMAYTITDFEPIKLIRKLQSLLLSIKQLAVQLNVSTKNSTNKATTL